MNQTDDILSMLGGQSSADILQLMSEDDDPVDGLDAAVDAAPSGALLKMEAKRRVCFDLAVHTHTSALPRSDAGTLRAF